MKEYSEKIFNQIQKIEDEIKNTYIPNSQKEKNKNNRKNIKCKIIRRNRSNRR